MPGGSAPSTPVRVRGARLRSATKPPRRTGVATTRPSAAGADVSAPGGELGPVDVAAGDVAGRDGHAHRQVVAGDHGADLGAEVAGVTVQRREVAGDERTGADGDGGRGGPVRERTG